MSRAVSSSVWKLRQALVVMTSRRSHRNGAGVPCRERIAVAEVRHGPLDIPGAQYDPRLGQFLLGQGIDPGLKGGQRLLLPDRRSAIGPLDRGKAARRRAHEYALHRLPLYGLVEHHAEPSVPWRFARSPASSENPRGMNPFLFSTLETPPVAPAGKLLSATCNSPLDYVIL